MTSFLFSMVLPKNPWKPWSLCKEYQSNNKKNSWPKTLKLTVSLSNVPVYTTWSISWLCGKWGLSEPPPKDVAVTLFSEKYVKFCRLLSWWCYQSWKSFNFLHPYCLFEMDWSLYKDTQLSSVSERKVPPKNQLPPEMMNMYSSYKSRSHLILFIHHENWSSKLKEDSLNTYCAPLHLV